MMRAQYYKIIQFLTWACLGCRVLLCFHPEGFLPGPEGFGFSSMFLYGFFHLHDHVAWLMWYDCRFVFK